MTSARSLIDGVTLFLESLCESEWLSGAKVVTEALGIDDDLSFINLKEENYILV